MEQILNSATYARNYRGSSTVFDENFVLDIIQQTLTTLGELATNTSTVSLDISHQDLNKDEIKKLVKNIKEHDDIEIINLEGNTTLKDGFKEICEALYKSSNEIFVINAAKCNLKKNQCKALISLFKRCKNLQAVHLGGNKEMKGRRKIFSSLSSSYNSLQHLNLSSCGLKKKHCNDLGTLLFNCSKIESIILSNNDKMGSGIINIAVGFSKAITTLKKIDFTFCKLSYINCLAICGFIKNSSKLESISMSFDLERQNFFEVICSALNKCSDSLKSLNFIRCHFFLINITPLSRFIVSASHLKEVDFSCNLFLLDQFIEICLVLETKANNIKRLSFMACYLKEENLEPLLRLLSKCCLERFYIDENEDLDAGFTLIIAILLTSCNSLKELSFSGCNLSEDQCIALGKLIKACSNIEILDVGENPRMGSGFEEIFSGLLLYRKNLKALNFDNCNLNNIQLLLYQKLKTSN